MAYLFSKPVLPIKLEVALNSNPMSPLSIVLLVAPETPALGSPGKQVGDFILKQTGKTMQVLVSLGKNDRIISDSYRTAGGAVGKWLLNSGAAEVDFEVSHADFEADPDSLQAFLEGLLLGAYQFNHYKKEKGSGNHI